jgi:hypothetical protein
MVEHLQRLLGRHGLCAALGVPWRTVLGWLAGKVPSAGAMRAIWLTWCLLFHPERLTSLHDIVTWGRFRIERRPAVQPGGWSGWVI